jgi:hypothetical protein
MDEEEPSTTIVHDRLETQLLELELRLSDDLRALAESPPPVIFHYTSPRGLHGMLQSAAIWATHAEFLNDRTELSYVEQVIASAAKSLEGEAHTRYSRELLRVLQLPNWRGYEPRDVFVACFSASSDSLSQWRAYANDGLGYAVGLATDVPFRVRNRPETTVLLLKVLYNKVDQEEAVRQALARIVVVFDRCSGLEDPGYVTFRGLVAVAQYVVPVGFALKNPGFAEEAEWRLVVIDEAPWPAGPHVHHRPSEFGLTPFVELETGEKLPLRKLTLGPRLHEDPARKGTVSALRKYRHNVILPTVEAPDRPEGVELTDSDTSYRGRPHHA